MKFSKILSLILAVGMLLSCMGNIAFADEAAVSVPTLVYDMDLTGYDIKTNTCIPNSVSQGSTATFTPGYNGSYRIQNMLNTNGDNVPVINFLKNNSTITFESADLANKSVTLEVWANIDLGTAGWQNIMVIQGEDSTITDDPETADNEQRVNGTKLFGYSPTASAYDYLLFGFQGQNSRYRKDGNVRTVAGAKTGDGTQFASGEWHQFILVRDMSDENSVVHSLYCDGDLWIQDEVNEKKPETDVTLTLSALKEFDCFKISDVKIYNGAKDATSIKNDYSSNKSLLTEKPLSDSLVFDADMDASKEDQPLLSQVVLSDTAKSGYLVENINKTHKGSFVGAELSKINYAQFKDDSGYLYFCDSKLANKSYTVDTWLNVGVDHSSYGTPVPVFEISGWTGTTLSKTTPTINSAVTSTCFNGNGNMKYTFGATNGGTTILKKGTFIHFAITREFTNDGKINVKYYVNGDLKHEEVLTSATEETAGWIIRSGIKGILHIKDLKLADVRLYGERVLDEAQIKALYTTEKDKYSYPTYTVSETCTITDTSDAAITEPETQLENGFKFSTGITSNAKAKTVVALYKNDTLYDYKVIDYNKGTTIDAAFDTVAYDATAAWKIKVMLLDGFTNLYPMTQAVTYKNVFATAN